MNILQVANKAIYPPDGGSLAILSLTKGYIENGHQVYLLNMNTHKHYNNDALIEDKYKQSLKIEGVEVNTKISVFKIGINLFFSHKPYIAQRFISEKFKSKLEDLLKNTNFDLVQCEGLYALQYIDAIKNNFKGKIIYRPHNLEYLIWERNYQKTKSIVKKWYFKLLSKRLKKLEKNLLNTYDYIIPISSADEHIFKKLGNKKPAKVAPFGIDIEKTKQLAVSKTNLNQSIHYIGALDWIPNQEGLLWFIQNCFDEIIKVFPTINLNIAGRNAPAWFVQKLNHPNIHYFGAVENAYDFLQNPGPMIVPLFSGSGMRIKIIEGMALKKAIVATTVAAEGIQYTDHNNILIADNKKEFSNTIIKLLNTNDLQNKIGENAYNFVKDQYDFIKIASDILNFIK